MNIVEAASIIPFQADSGWIQTNKQTLIVLSGLSAAADPSMAPSFQKTYYTTPDSFGAYKHEIIASQIHMSAANKRKKYQCGEEWMFLDYVCVLFFQKQW